MARPKKQTVEYFPHQCLHGRTVFILEQKYGNNGYAFWFKLLEILGSTAGHFLDFNQIDNWEFLTAKTHLDDSLCTEIMDCLARLEAIDSGLWAQKIVWSDNFICNIADAYRRRSNEMPIKPSLCIQKPPPTVVSADINPQSKLKETKRKETKLNNTRSHEDVLSALSPSLRSAMTEFIQFRKASKKPMTARAVELALADLCKLSQNEQTQVDIINQSVSRGWTGFYELAQGKATGKPAYKPGNMGNFNGRAYSAADDAALYTDPTKEVV